MTTHPTSTNAFPTVLLAPTGSQEIIDSGKVRIGNTSPSFPPVRVIPTVVTDSGKVRIGNTSPSFPPVRVTPTIVTDNGKVRIGNTSPSFPPARQPK